MSAILRFFKISWVVIKYRLDETIPKKYLPAFLNFLLMIAPWKWLPKSKISRGVRIRLALEELGPVYIKFGQTLSTRRDILPDDIADELQKLQDQVPPFSGKESVKIIEKSFKKSIHDIFVEFNEEPMASASVAQVHNAILNNQNGQQEVVVKIIRPNIHKLIARDIKILYFCARLLAKFWHDGKRMRPVEVVHEYEKTINNELDLLREAANTSQLRRNFLTPEFTGHNEAVRSLLYVPEVYWDYSCQNILVMERIHGIPITDIAALKAQHTDMKKLADRGVEIFFTQVFRHNFFHADMHPGNIFVSHDNPENPQYIAVDCGIMGSLTPEDKNYIARNLLAFFKQDYHQVAALHIECGWVSESTPVNEFEAEVRCVCEPIFAKPLKDISFAQLLLQLFQTARRFNMEVQPQLVLLQKTLLNIEGLGRQIYPDLDLWNTAYPFLENWMKERLDPRSILKNFRQHTPAWLDQFPQLPQIAISSLQQIKNLEQQAKSQQHAMEALTHELKQKKPPRWPLVTGALVLISALFIANGQTSFSELSIKDIPLTSWILGGIGLILINLKR